MDNNNQVLTLRGNIINGLEVTKGYIRIEEGLISEVGDFESKGTVFDFGDSYIVPGFIDLHIHGIHHSLVDNSPDDLSEMCNILPQYGVTGFLPTVSPRPVGEDAVFLSRLAHTKTYGSEILGFHLEGPFIKLTGAFNNDAISKSDKKRVEALIQAAKPYKAIFSISPDVEGIEDLLPIMTENNNPVFITHTEATVAQTQAAIGSGAMHATHFYDVFPCPAVTEPGVRPCGAVEAILADERVSVDFILDGVHVDPIAVKLALLCKSNGPGSVCLISDSVPGAGLEPGPIHFDGIGEIEFAYKGSPARIIKNKVLAGGGLTMDQALRNAVSWLDLDLPSAIRLVSTNPAEVTGAGHRKGHIIKGYDADFVILDKKLNVIQTWIGGKCVFKK